MSEYLAKFIARCGAAARRKAADLVKSGKVLVNGRVVIDPAFLVDGSRDKVVLNGAELKAPQENVYIMLNKPVGYTTSHSDKHADHLAVELIDCPEAQRLVPAGRLDRDSEGLLIFSNDGNFIQQLAHPRYNVCKEYRVLADKALDAAAQRRMLNGIKDDNELLRALKVSACSSEDNCYIIVLNEGRKRQIRRMLRACGAATLRLQRISVGSVRLGDLPAGKWRHLTEEEVNSLHECCRQGQ